MYPHQKSAVFFDSDIIDTDTWKLKQLAKAALELIWPQSELYAFIQANDEKTNSYVIMVAHRINNPMSAYKADIIDEDTYPHMECIFKDIFQTLL